MYFYEKLRSKGYEEIGKKVLLV